MSPTSLMTISRWSRNTVGIRRTECRRYNLRMFESMETNLNWAIGSMKSCLIGISRDVEMVRSHKQKSRSPNLVRSHRSGKHLCGVCVAMLAERQRPTPASRQPIRAYQERRVDLLWKASFRSRNGEVLCVETINQDGNP